MLRRPLCLFCTLLCLLAAMRLLLYPAPPGFLPEWEGQSAVLEGTVQDCYLSLGDEPVQIIYVQNAVFCECDASSARDFNINSEFYSNSKFNSDSSIRPFPSEKNKTFGVICYSEQKTVPKIGSRVRLRGKIRLFLPATNHGEFDQEAYQRRKGYDFSLRDAAVTGESKGYDRIGQKQWELKQYLTKVLYKVYPEKEAGVLEAMLLGNKRNLNPELKERFQQANISHILSISGLHISLIGMGIFRFLRKRKTGIYVASGASFLLLFLYGGMTGFGVSTGRAVFMFAFYMGAQVSKRTYDMPTAIASAAAMLVLREPEILFDTGFLLSFGAVLGVAVMIPAAGKLRRPFHQPVLSGWEKRKEMFWSAFLGGLCVSISTLPLVLSSFYEWNIYSVAANMIVIPLMGILMPAALLVLAVAALLIPTAGETGIVLCALFSIPVRLLLYFLEAVSKAAAECWGGRQYAGSPVWWKWCVFGIGIGIFIWKAEKMKRWQAAAVLCAVAALLLWPVRIPEQVTFVDVGQGECIYIHSKSGRNYLVDCGSSSKSDTGRYQVIPFLKYNGVKKLDAVFVSHWDADHINGLESLFSERPHMVEKLVLPDTAQSDEELEKLLLLAEEHNVPILYLKSGDVWEDSGVSFHCLYPYAGIREEDRNDCSMVLLLKIEQYRILFTGDLGEKGERWLLEHCQEEIADCHILKAGHHGSLTSNSMEFLETVNPGLVFISCGKNNRYGHPSPETLRRLEILEIPYMITAERGEISVKFRNREMAVSAFLPENGGIMSRQ